MSKWVMAPVGPTIQMQSAALTASRKFGEDECPLPRCKEVWASGEIYPAMIAARPALSSLAQDELRAIAAEANRIAGECEGLLNTGDVK